MNTARTYPCPYCKSVSTTPFYSMSFPISLNSVQKEYAETIPVEPVNLSVCHQCKLGFNTTPLNDEILEKIYQTYVYIKPTQNIGHTKNQFILKTVKDLVSPDARVVEIGCHEGFLLGELKKAGFTDLTGVEPSSSALKITDPAITVRQEFFTHKSFAKDSVDAFVLSHVFEHFPDPFSIFNDLLYCLKENGKIIIEVPDFDGYHHQHLFYYSPEFFQRMADDCGAYIERMQHTPPDLLAVFTKKQPHSESEMYHYDTLKKAEKTQVRISSAIQNLTDFLDKNAQQPIIWWGSGSLTIMLISHLHATNKHYNIRIVDNDASRHGQVIPQTDYTVESPAICGDTIPALVIGSSFDKEILAGLAEKGISVQNVFPAYTHWTASHE